MTITAIKVLMLVGLCLLTWTATAQEQNVQTPQSAEVEESPLSVSITASFMSKYVWRGQVINDDYVFQPAGDISYGNLTAGWWGNLDMTEYTKDDAGNDNQWEFTEHDWTVSYGDGVPGIDLLNYSVGIIYYHLASCTVNTSEVFGELGLDVPLNPTFSIYRDVDEIDGTYLSFGISHTIEKLVELAPDMPLGLVVSASVGWGSDNYNKGYWYNEDDESKSVQSDSMQDLTLSAEFPVDVLGWTLTPSVHYVSLLDGDVRDADTYATYSGNNDSDYFFTGITFSKEF